MKKQSVLVGISGGIAVYKSCELVRSLVKLNYNVYTVMTKNALEFVTPLTFKTLSNNPVYINMFDENTKSSMPHISLSDECNIMVIAPATGNIIAKMAHGLADDLLSSLCLSFPRRIIIAPAMNEKMYLNPIFQENLNKLKKYKNKYTVIGPEKGALACGVTGLGRMSKVEDIVKAVRNEIK